MFHAIPTYQVDGLCGPAAIAAYGADVFPCAARPFRWLFGSTLGGPRCAAPCAGAQHIPKAQPLCHLDGRPALRFDEIQQGQAGACNRPAVFGVFFDAQPVPLGGGLEFAVVVTAPAPAAILYAVHDVEQVAHFMQQRGAGFFYGPVQRGGADIDLIPLYVARRPCFVAGDMPIGARRLFKGDNLCSVPGTFFQAARRRGKYGL